MNPGQNVRLTNHLTPLPGPLPVVGRGRTLALAKSRRRRFGFGVRLYFHITLTRPIAPIDVRKNVVEPFDSFEPGLIDFAGGELSVKGKEAKQVSFDALPGVFRAGASPQDERPIAGLGEEQLARGLFEGAFLER